MTNPYGQDPYQQQGQSPYQQPAGPMGYGQQMPQNNGMATASMIVSLAALILCWLSLIVAPVGAILGHVALRQIKRNPQQYTNRGMALTGVIIGWIVFGIYAAIFVFYVVIFGYGIWLNQGNG